MDSKYVDNERENILKDMNDHGSPQLPNDLIIITNDRESKFSLSMGTECLRTFDYKCGSTDRVILDDMSFNSW